MSPEILTIFMFSTLIIGLFLGHPLAFVLGGVGVMTAVIGVGPQALGMMISRIHGNVMDNYILVAVPLFILMARFLGDSGVTDRMFRTLRLLLGGLRGGLTLAVIMLSVLLAATTGIIGASITVIGMIALTPMLRYGYDKRMSSGAIVAGGSLGVLIPPSIMLLIMASYSPVSVGQLFAGAILPGLLLSGLYALYVLLISFFVPHLAPPVPIQERQNVSLRQLTLSLITDVIPPVVLILGVLGTIFVGIATVTEASAIGAFLSFCFLIIYGNFSVTSFFDALFETGRVTSMVLFVVVGATAFTGVFTAGGGVSVVSNLIIGTGLPDWAVILLSLVIIFILGMFLDWIGIVLLCFPIFVPIMQQLDVDVLWFIVLSAVVLQTSFLTPPFGYALFYLKGIAPPEVTMEDIYIGSIPYAILIIFAALAVASFPGLALWLPSML